jgi:molybdate transport repressor ModE-like protein
MAHDLEIRHCRVLVAVSEHRSISAAARELGLAQSTISETLLSLERVIGAPVMLRRPGKEAILTSAAETLLPHARSLIAASVGAVASVSADNRGAIRLGAVESISSYLLPTALRQFRARWPSVEVQINIGLCDELRRRVLRAELEAALTLDDMHSAAAADSCSRSLAPARLCFVVSSRPSARSARVTKAELSERTFLLPDPEGALPKLLRAWFGELGAPRFSSAGSIDGVINGIRSGDMIGVLPSYAVAAPLASGSLFELKAAQPPPDVFVGLTVQHAPLEASPLQEMILQIEKSLTEFAAGRAGVIRDASRAAKSTS